MSNRKIYWTKSKNPFEKLGKSHPGEFDSPEPMMQMTAIETPIGIIGEIEDILQDDEHIWVAHSNFDITDEHIYDIEAIPGVEGLRPLTRYRFQVAVGLMFNEEAVKENIEEMLCQDRVEEALVYLRSAKKPNPKISKELEDKVNDAIAAITEKYWAILMLPNGEINVLTANELDENFVDAVAINYSTFLFVGGYFTSNIGV